MADQSLYDPTFERGACGLGFVARADGRRSHEIVEQGLEVLRSLAHRGATGSDPETGDGAGILLQMPDAYFRRAWERGEIRSHQLRAMSYEISAHGSRLRAHSSQLTAHNSDELPPAGSYGVGTIFFTQDPDLRLACERELESIAAEEGQPVLGWRDVPIRPDKIGSLARGVMPCIRQVFIARTHTANQAAFERKLYVIRRRLHWAVQEKLTSSTDLLRSPTRGRGAGGEGTSRGVTEQAASPCYVVSLSSRTIVYKGLLRGPQLAEFYPDLKDPSVISALALIHSRFSTNTLGSWPLAHPYRYIAHNGEINALRGNINWLRAREHELQKALFPRKMHHLGPIVQPGGSDTSAFDNALEFLVLAGRSLPHAIMTMIPEPWENDEDMNPDQRAFYQYTSSLVPPWDGPAAIAFSDGRVVGATLDRNGLRPARYSITKDGLVILASEEGVLPVPPEDVVARWRLQPGRMLLVDTVKGRVYKDDEVKRTVVRHKPYRRWVEESLIHIDELPDIDPHPPAPSPAMQERGRLLRQQRAFGYTLEDLKILLTPMAQTGKEPDGSMGTDTPLAVLSERSQLLFSYFHQLFAQVSNPPIDPLREDLVMSLGMSLGPEPNLIDEYPGGCRQLLLDQPVLSAVDMEKLRVLDDGPLRSATLPIVFRVSEGEQGLEQGVEQLCRAAQEAIEGGASILILSDRDVDAEHAPIPSLLATSAVHHHLVRERMRTHAGLVVETAEAREVHHFALLVGYGAVAVHPYLAFETIDRLAEMGRIDGVSMQHARANYSKAIEKGLLKVISKMGISTLVSYCGAQVFEAVGLGEKVIERYFTGTASRIGGAGIEELAREALIRHARAFGETEDVARDSVPASTRSEERAEGRPHIASGTSMMAERGGDGAPTPSRERSPALQDLGSSSELDLGGDYQLRAQGEYHQWNPDTIAWLQRAVQTRSFDSYKEYSRHFDAENARLATLRGLFDFQRDPIPFSEVEPVEEIVKRFSTGAMSFGSISKEAHETLAIAMNRIGGKSNTGEGGEDSARFIPDPNGDSRRSAIKQVASARFGVTVHYLVNADVLQIKMAQGSKPGEGGQLPGHKVSEEIARTRYSTPGVGLISPPPHHDIYSIEDLAQLIHDLKNVNPDAQISVKLVSEVGVGTIAAGVSKAKADHITIAGYDGGTGASPLSSIKHAGLPWELGLAEAQQVLVANNLRGRVRLQADGQLKTGRDVVVAALLGADEFAFSTAPLVATGCIMMRACHLNTCPVGIATQNPELRKRFAGKPEHVINFFFFLAQEVRELMAELGFRRFEDVVGRSDRLCVRQAVDHWKAGGLDVSPLLGRPSPPNPLSRNAGEGEVPTPEDLSPPLEATAGRADAHGSDGIRGSTTGDPLGGSGVRGLAIHHTEKQDHRLHLSLDKQLIEAVADALDVCKPVSFEVPIHNTNRTVGAMLSGEITRRFGQSGLPDETIRISFRGTAGQSFGAWAARGLTLILEGETNDYAGKGLSGGRLIVAPPPHAGYDPERSIVAGNVALYGATGGEAYFRGVAGERFAVRNSGARAVVEGVGDHGCEYMTGGVVLVLGPTGRNFAAGMSGGMAFALDLWGRFRKACNLDMVELEALEHHEDIALVRMLLARHLEYTSSSVAKRVLDNWHEYLPRFVKVMPHDLKRVMVESAALEEQAG
jgi:glutamate synthase domain-containing protein 2/glutamate synthase domain-containing protein 1/glutamate synthase domain-containing protein 3